MNQRQNEQQTGKTEVEDFLVQGRMALNARQRAFVEEYINTPLVTTLNQKSLAVPEWIELQVNLDSTVPEQSTWDLEPELPGSVSST